ncbi:MAG: DUF748 domain-containing protein [Zoogloeaceae bacterium]|jgi:hypothetical protein|nr:DUF748 domain-containing protein [Zoogloeaceae bacterium]
MAAHHDEKKPVAAKGRRGCLGIFLGFLLMLLVAGGIAVQYARGWAEQEILALLGAGSSVREVNLGLDGLELLEVRLPAPAGWPAAETFRAQRVQVRPDWAALLRGRLRLRQVILEKPYVSVLRTADRLSLLPTLALKPGADRQADFAAVAQAAGMSPAVAGFGLAAVTAGTGSQVDIGQIVFSDGSLEWFDTTLGPSALRLRLEGLSVQLGGMRLPAVPGTVTLEVSALVKGVHHDGKLGLRGTVDVVGENADLELKLQNLDLPPLQPYFIRQTDASLSEGSLDMEARIRLAQGQLSAPVSLSFSGLRVANDSPSFLGLPRDLAFWVLQALGNRLEARFTVAGNLNAPEFSLNDSLRQQMTLGFSSLLQQTLRRLPVAAQWLGLEGAHEAQGR